MQKEPGFLTLEWRAPIHVTLKGKLKVEMKAFESPIWSHSAKKKSWCWHSTECFCLSGECHHCPLSEPSCFIVLHSSVPQAKCSNITACLQLKLLISFFQAALYADRLFLKDLIIHAWSSVGINYIKVFREAGNIYSIAYLNSWITGFTERLFLVCFSVARLHAVTSQHKWLFYLTRV